MNGRRNAIGAEGFSSLLFLKNGGEKGGRTDTAQTMPGKEGIANAACCLCFALIKWTI